MGLISWYRKRKGILNEPTKPEFQINYETEEYLSVTSCLSINTVFEMIREISPTPEGFVWSLRTMEDSTDKRGQTFYIFKLTERKDHEKEIGLSITEVRF